MTTTTVLHVSERKELYRFLAQLFSYPDADLVTNLAADDAYAVAGLVAGLPAPPAGPFSLAELEIAYTDLFINRLGGAPAPPYGSVYLEPEERLMGPTTLEVGAAYRAQGLKLEGSGEPPDFLATELEFLYYLVTREEEAFGRRQVDKAREATAVQADFGPRLVYSWVPDFCQRIETDPQGHPLYRWGAVVLKRFAELERNWLAKVS